MAANRGWAARSTLTDVVSVKLPHEVVAALDSLAEVADASRSDVVRAALLRVTGPTPWPDAAGTAVVQEVADAIAPTSARGAAS